MKVFLMQHGEAMAKETNPDRPLTDRGRSDVERVAHFLGLAGIRVSAVRHSGKLRAVQTAELMLGTVGQRADLAEVSGIGPTDPVEAFAAGLTESSAGAMIVGHLPFLGRLVSLLTARDAEAGVVAFEPGSVVCLEQDDEGSWAIAWMVRPRLIP